jgi:hypothetical protein
MPLRIQLEASGRRYNVVAALNGDAAVPRLYGPPFSILPGGNGKFAIKIAPQIPTRLDPFDEFRNP